MNAIYFIEVVCCASHHPSNLLSPRFDWTWPVCPDWRRRTPGLTNNLWKKFASLIKIFDKYYCRPGWLAEEMHKLNEAVTRQSWLSNDGGGLLAPQLTQCGEGEQPNLLPTHDGGEINRNQISPQGIWDLRAKLNHVKMMMMMVKLYIRYISADVFVILLSSAAFSPHHGQLKVVREMRDGRVRFRASEDWDWD